MEQLPRCSCSNFLPQLSWLSPRPPCAFPACFPFLLDRLGLPPPILCCYYIVVCRSLAPSPVIQPRSLLGSPTSVVTLSCVSPFSSYCSSASALPGPHPNVPQPPNFPLLSALPFLLLFFFLPNISLLFDHPNSSCQALKSCSIFQLTFFTFFKSPCPAARERLKRRSSSASPAATKSLKKSKLSHSPRNSCLERICYLGVALTMRPNRSRYAVPKIHILSPWWVRWFAPQRPNSSDGLMCSTLFDASNGIWKRPLRSPIPSCLIFPGAPIFKHDHWGSRHYSGCATRASNHLASRL